MSHCTPLQPLLLILRCSGAESQGEGGRHFRAAQALHLPPSLESLGTPRAQRTLVSIVNPQSSATCFPQEP